MFLNAIRIKKCVIKAVNECPFVSNCFPDQYKTQEMCYTVVSNDPPLIVNCPDKYITQKMCDEAVDEHPFLTVYWADIYITQKKCDEAVAYSLTVLKLILNWFVTSEMIKKIFTALYADKNIVYFDEGSGHAVFNCKRMAILNIDFNNVSLDDKFDEDDPNTIILMRLLTWHIIFRKWKEVKKELSEELMPVAWHPNRCCDWCMSGEEKKIDPMFIEEL